MIIGMEHRPSSHGAAVPSSRDLAGWGVPRRGVIFTKSICKRWSKINKRGWRDVRILCLATKHPDCTIKQATKVLRRSGRLLTSVRLPVTYDRAVYLRVIQKYCPHIIKLELVFDYLAFRPVLHCYRKTFSALLVALEKLNWLVMAHINQEVGTKQLRVVPSGLKRLEMSANVVFGIITPFYADLSRFTNLQALSLQYFVIRKESFESLEQLRNLKELNLSFSYVFDGGIEKIQNFEKLERLELEQRTTQSVDLNIIEDYHITHIAERCQRLKMLKLNGLVRLTDRCFRTISTLKHLEVVHMESLPLVTNRSIVKLHQVQTLNCSYCSGIDHQGLGQLIKNSQNLVELDARGTTNRETFFQDIADIIINRNLGLTINIECNEKFLFTPGRVPMFQVLV
ncbi:uncharacterized protein LOC135160349 isoform X2 [Diachasmimorpha longicaudata]|uniref:uncharacterized protein LOC135160349 isoform X2 n=1 Tax=Diachasmimorpha longicaudata TaxID=58733 RepID=UPI0030B8DB67